MCFKVLKCFQPGNHVDLDKLFRRDLLPLGVDDVGIDDLDNSQPGKGRYYNLTPNLTLA